MDIYSSSWCLQPHIGVSFLVWPLLRAGMVVLDQFFSQMYFLYIWQSPPKNLTEFWGVLAPQNKVYFRALNVSQKMGSRGASSSASGNQLSAGPIWMHFKISIYGQFELVCMECEYHCVTNDGVSHWWLFCFLYISNLHVSHQCSFRLSWILNVDTTQITTSTYKL